MPCAAVNHNISAVPAPIPVAACICDGNYPAAILYSTG
jgi:hypothetical protein